MTEILKKAVIKELKDAYGLPIFAEEVAQGAKDACFSVEIENMQEKRLLGRRRERTVSFAIHYFYGQEKMPVSQGAAIADRLYGILCMVGQEESFFAGEMKHETKEDSVIFHVSYRYHILMEEENTLMERLEYNGRKAAGYEENGSV